MPGPYLGEVSSLAFLGLPQHALPHSLSSRGEIWFGDSALRIDLRGADSLVPSV
ncbi:unnamed protein product [Brassica napus]|uniref:(rape) hypothetical protein n=1 Tax=Brassica napus TaxID=3708 RepID=A0A816KXB6_BRANA|nr:unnamed protein product [Brassica napus]